MCDRQRTQLSGLASILIQIACSLTVYTPALCLAWVYRKPWIRFQFYSKMSMPQKPNPVRYSWWQRYKDRCDRDWEFYSMPKFFLICCCGCGYPCQDIWWALNVAIWYRVRLATYTLQKKSNATRIVSRKLSWVEAELPVFESLARYDMNFILPPTVIAFANSEWQYWHLVNFRQRSYSVQRLVLLLSSL